MLLSHPTAFWPLFTRLGEAQLLLPLSLFAAAWLTGPGGQGRLARRWMAGLAVAAALTTLSKIAFLGFGLGLAAWDFTGFSGHAMFAAATLPLLGRTCAQGRRGQSLGLWLGLLLALLVAYSRVQVSAHSVSEAVLGCLLGLAATGLGLSGAHPQARVTPIWLPALALLLMLVVPLAGPRSRTHDWVVALSLELSGRHHPYTREHLHARAGSTPSPVQDRSD